MTKSFLFIIITLTVPYLPLPHAAATSGQQITLPFATAWGPNNPTGLSKCQCNQVYAKTQNFLGPLGTGTPLLNQSIESSFGFQIWQGAYGFSLGDNQTTKYLGAFGYFGGGNSYGELKLFDSVTDQSYTTPFRIENHTHVSIWYLHYTNAGRYNMIDALLYNQNTGQYALLGDFSSIVDQNGYRMSAAYRGSDPVGNWAHAVFNLDPVFNTDPFNWFVLLILVRWDNSQSSVTGQATTFFGDMRWTYSTVALKKAVSPNSYVAGTLFYLVTTEFWAQRGDPNNIGTTDLSLKVTVLGYSKAVWNQYLGGSQTHNMYPNKFSVAESSSSQVYFPSPDDKSVWSPTGANLTQELTSHAYDWLLDPAELIVEIGVTYSIPELGVPLLIAHLAADAFNLAQPPDNGSSSYTWPLVSDLYMNTGNTVTENDALGEIFLTAKWIDPTNGMTAQITPTLWYAISLFGGDSTTYSDNIPLTVAWSATPHSPSGSPNYTYSYCPNQNDAGTGGDAGNSFGAATSPSPPPSGSWTGCLTRAGDTEDWYKFNVSLTQSITATVTPNSNSTYNLELYSPNGAIQAGFYPGGVGNISKIQWNPACTSGSWAIRVFNTGFQASGGGNYSFSISVTSGSSCSPVYSGGSIMAGTQVLMSDGSWKLVQNTAAGMVIRSFDPSSYAFFNATITRVAPKTVNNLYVISTSIGNPIRVDYYEDFWVQLPNGQVQWMHAGLVQVGDKILRPVEGVWATITSIEIDTGTYTVYDLIVTPTLPGGGYSVIANGYLDRKVP